RAGRRGATAGREGRAACGAVGGGSVPGAPACSSSAIGSSVAGLTTVSPTLATLEQPLAFPAGDDLVEEALFDASVVEVVLDDIVPEGRAREAPLLQRVDRVAQRRREALRVGLVRVPLERVGCLQLLLDAVQTRC